MGDRIADDVEDVLLANWFFHHAENAGDDMRDHSRIGCHEYDENPGLGQFKADVRPRRSVCQVEVAQGNIGFLGSYEAPCFPSARCDPHRLMTFILNDGFHLKGDKKLIFYDQDSGRHD